MHFYLYLDSTANMQLWVLLGSRESLWRPGAWIHALKWGGGSWNLQENVRTRYKLPLFAHSLLLERCRLRLKIVKANVKESLQMDWHVERSHVAMVSWEDKEGCYGLTLFLILDCSSRIVRVISVSPSTSLTALPMCRAHLPVAKGELGGFSINRLKTERSTHCSLYRPLATNLISFLT